MRLKYIIAVLVGGGSILFGAYNWISFFKGQAPVPAAQIQALRPPPDPALVQLEQAAGSPEAQPQAQPDTQPGPLQMAGLPDTVCRNPFMTPQEIEALARGTLVTLPVAQAAQAPEVSLPEHKLTGILLDTSSGKYRAIIEGRIYRTGDDLGLEKIVEITGNTVVLEYNGKTRNLVLSRVSGEGVANIKLKSKP